MRKRKIRWRKNELEKDGGRQKATWRDRGDEKEKDYMEKEWGKDGLKVKEEKKYWGGEKATEKDRGKKDTLEKITERKAIKKRNVI